MPKFVQKEPLKGFDDKAQCQFVPLNGSRVVGLQGAGDLPIVFGPAIEPAGMLWRDQGAASAPSREIVLDGRRAGYHWLEVREKSTYKPLSHFDVIVLPERVVNVAYYILSRGITEAEILDMHSKARELLLNEANIRYEKVEVAIGDSGDVKLSHPIGNSTTEDRTNLMRTGNHPAAAHLVYFVRGIRDATKEPRKPKKGAIDFGEPGPNGQTFVNITLINIRDAKEHPYYLTLAHELGHFLSSGSEGESHDNDSKNNLMFDGSPHGSFLPKSRILRWYPGLGAETATTAAP